MHRHANQGMAGVLTFFLPLYRHIYVAVITSLVLVTITLEADHDQTTLRALYEEEAEMYI